MLSSRGKLILSATKTVPNKNSFTITFPATFDMVPTAKFVVYYILPSGDIVSTNINIPVTGLNNFVSKLFHLDLTFSLRFRLQVTLKTSAAEKKPGEKVDITISTKPSSNVCILGVDQSVVLLKSGKL